MLIRNAHSAPIFVTLSGLVSTMMSGRLFMPVAFNHRDSRSRENSDNLSVLSKKTTTLT